VKPLVDKLVQFLFLRQTIEQLFFIIETNRWRRRLPVHEKIRFSILAKALDGLLEFKLGTGLVARPVRAHKFFG